MPPGIFCILINAFTCVFDNIVGSGNWTFDQFLMLSRTNGKAR